MQLHQLGFGSGTWVRVTESGFKFVSELHNGEVIVSILFVDVRFGLYKGLSFQKREEEVLLFLFCLVVWIVCEFKGELHEKRFYFISVSMKWVRIWGLRRSFFACSYCL